MYLTSPPHERYRSAVLSLTMVGLCGWALLSGLSVDKVVHAVAPLISVDFPTAPPPKPPEPPHVRPRPIRHSAAKHKAGARNLKNKATPIVAPMIRPIVTPPVIAAPKPNQGLAANTGASNRAGSGEGAGGYGNGNGGGGNGGEGDGDFPPEQIGGQLKFADLPPQLAETARSATVEVRYYVETNGRASGCRVTGSSGNTALDATGCQIVEQRFRFRPSRDESGRPVRSIMVQRLNWTIDRNGMGRDDG